MDSPVIPLDSLDFRKTQITLEVKITNYLSKIIDLQEVK